MEPMISVLVMTYQSEKTVLETLESVYDQTYQNIELIVTDDGSTDQTLSVANEWLDANCFRFVHAVLVPSPGGVNYGISHNANKGIAVANGQYIRLIAGDDTLTPDSIELCVFHAQNQQKDWVVGKVDVFGDSDQEWNATEGNSLYDIQFRNLQKPISQQFKALIAENFFVAPGANFYSRKMYDAIGGYDEHYQMLEDYPFFVRAYQLGYYPYVLDQLVGHYRIHGGSITHTQNSPVRTQHWKDTKRFFFSTRLWLLLRSAQWRKVLGQALFYGKR